MFELIIVIIIISVAVKSNKKKNTGKPSAKPNVPRTQVKPTPIPGRQVQSRQMTTGQVQRRPAAGTVTPGKPITIKEEMTTTEMLEAKALADDKDERLEEQRRRVENKKHYGNHNYAGKYIIGDAVPKGKKMVFCSYCNAENLIPTYSSAREYNCYFCREKL